MMVGGDDPSSLADASPSEGDEAKTARNYTLSEPRLLTKARAARYCALSCRGFSAWVKLGRLPGPIPGTKRWDRRAIDSAIDEATRKAANENLDNYDTWKARHHENKSKGSSYGKKKAR